MTSSVHSSATWMSAALVIEGSTMSTKLITVTTPIAVYRLHLANLAAAAGCTVSHVSTVETRFTKGTKVLVTTWAPSQLSEAAELSGKTIKVIAPKGSKGRLQKVWAWVTGDQTISENTLFTNRAGSKPDMAALKAQVAKGAIKAPAPVAEAKAEVKAKVAPKAPAKAKAPSQAGPSQEARQASRDAEHLAEM